MSNHEEMKTIEERLNEQLHQKDREIRKLEARIEELERDVRSADAGWTIHAKLDTEQTLPVPRLEIIVEANGYTDNPWYERIYTYRLIYKALWGDVIAIPIGRTTSQGGDGRRPVFTDGPYAGKVQMPFRDGAQICHDMQALKLPGFLVCEDVVTDISHLADKPQERW